LHSKIITDINPVARSATNRGYAALWRIKVTALLVALLFLCAVLLGGCIGVPRPPRGYAYGGARGAPILSNGWSARFGLIRQFYVENRDISGDYQYFVLDGQIYRVRIRRARGVSGGPWMGVLNSLYRADGQHRYYRIGDFVTTVDWRADFHEVAISFVFVDVWSSESYIYYQLSAVRQFWAVDGIGHGGTWSFSKYRFFRLCLNTGINEEVALGHFFSRLWPIYMDAPAIGDAVHSVRDLTLNQNFRVRQ